MNRAMFTALMVFTLAGTLKTDAQTVGRLPEKVPNKPQTRRIDVGGYSLRLIVSPGEDSRPAIVLEAGGGSDSSQWGSLQPRIATVTGCTVVSYDRAGFGESDLPRGSYDVVEELEALRLALERIGVAKRVILVGHSYGGLLVQLYTHMYPDGVAGAVLLDTNTVEFVDSIGGSQKLMDIPFPTDPPLDRTRRSGIRQIMAFDRTVELLRHAPAPATIPFVIVAAGRDWWPNEGWGESYRVAQRHLAEVAPNRRFMIADRAAHNIPGDQPDTVIDAIKSLLTPTT